MVLTVVSSAIPDPVTVFSRWQLWSTRELQRGLAEFLQWMYPIPAADAPTPGEWRRFAMNGNAVTGGTPKEAFTTTMDIVNITGGNIDNSWTQQDYLDVVGILQLLTSAWANSMDSNYHWTDIKAYRMLFNPMSIVEPLQKSGPPVFTAQNVQVGVGATHQAPQVAVTSTDRTAFPRHWGRNYWPHPTAAAVLANGHIATSYVDALANAINTCYTSLAAKQFFPVVVSTQVGGVPERSLLSVTNVQVDDVFDVIRRRRSPTTTYRKILPALPAAAQNPVEELQVDGEDQERPADQQPDQPQPQ
jgi:hypothetical protein